MEISKSKLFFTACLAFIVGIGLRSFFEIPVFSAYLLALAGLVILVLGWQKPYLRAAALAAFFLFLGIGRFQISEPNFNNSEKIYFYNNQPVMFEGVVVKEPDEKMNFVRLTVQAKKVSGQPSGGKILVKTRKNNYQYGDRLKIFCDLKKPEKIEDFDYDKYLARYDIYSVCYWPKEIEVLESNQGNPVIVSILKLKTYLVSLAYKFLPQSAAPFFVSLLLGARERLSSSFFEMMNRAGISHLIAVSGLHISLIIKILAGFFGFLRFPRRRSFWLLTLIVIVFVILVGARAGAIRAGLMGFLVILAAETGRVKSMRNILALTAAVMLAINPKLLVFDVAFELSFLATIGIIYLSPIFEEWFKKIPSILGSSEALAASFSAIIFTLPLVVFKFGRISLIAPLTNLLVIPVVPLIMILGLAALAIGSVWLAAAKILGYALWFLISYVTNTAELLAALPFAHYSVEISKIPLAWLWLILAYLILFTFVFWLVKKIPQR